MPFVVARIGSDVGSQIAGRGWITDEPKCVWRRWIGWSVRFVAVGNKPRLESSASCQQIDWGIGLFCADRVALCGRRARTARWLIGQLARDADLRLQKRPRFSGVVKSPPEKSNSHVKGKDRKPHAIDLFCALWVSRSPTVVENRTDKHIHKRHKKKRGSVTEKLVLVQPPVHRPFSFHRPRTTAFRPFGIRRWQLRGNRPIRRFLFGGSCASVIAVCRFSVGRGGHLKYTSTILVRTPNPFSGELCSYTRTSPASGTCDRDALLVHAAFSRLDLDSLIL